MLRTLSISKSSTFYIHGLDPALPPETWLPTIDSLHKEGLFASFGLPNFNPTDAEAIHTLCVQSSWVPPTTYQGNLSALARH